jgi:tryptophan halogenase
LEEVEGATLPADRIEGSSNGWRWSQPLPGRTAVTVAGTDEGASFAYGHRARPWVGNVVAIGEAAGTVDPLYGINLQLAHAAILRALELLPGRDFDRVEVAEYNRRTELVMIRARDFLALHYLRPDRPVPDSLGHTIDQFGERGRLPFYADESFTRDSWVAALLGMGIVPKRGDAVAGRIDENTSLDAMDRLAASLENLPARLPPYSEYLRQLLPAAMR